MVEFEDAASERMAQLEQEDLERYQRDASRNSNYSYDDETPNYVDEFQSKLSVLLDLVRGCINDFHRTPSSTVNGYEPSAMNIQPVSFTDDVASCNYSDLRSEATDEQLSDDEYVVNVLPDYAEMMDFDGIQGTDSSNPEMVTDLEEYKVSESSINSQSSVNSSPHKQLTHIDSGFKVLSIYCAHMATKWRPVLDSQPIQGNEMSVVVYYDRFCDWKKKLDEVDYIGGEESYIDDFLYGLKRELAVRILEYKWKPHTLYGAFRRALIEENMMKNDTDKVLEGMPHSNSIGIQGVKHVLDENVNVVLDASVPLDVKLLLDLPAESNSFQSGKWDQYFKDATLEIMFGEIVVFKFNPGIGSLFEEKFQSIQNAQMDEHVMKESASSLSIVHSTIVSGNKHFVIEVDLSTLIDSELLMKKFSFDPGGCPLSNLKMYEQSTLIELNKGGVVDKGVVLSVIDLQATLGSSSDTTVNSSSNYSTKAWVEGAQLMIVVVLEQKDMKKYDSSIVDEMPPTFQVGAKNEQLMSPYIIGIDSNQLTIFYSDSKNFVVSVCSSNVFPLITDPEILVHYLKGIEGLFMFTYDPGGCCLFYNGCVCPEFNVDHGGCCLDTIIADLRDTAIMHTLSIWIISLGGVILLIGHIFSKNGLDGFDLGTNLNKEFRKCFEYVIMSIINDYVSSYISAATVFIHVMGDSEPCELMLYQNQLMDALKLRSINLVTEMKSWMFYVRGISSKSQLPFCSHSFVAFQNPCCVLECFIPMLRLVDYKVSSHDLGSCTILVLENSCMPDSDSHAVISLILVCKAHRGRLSKSLIEGSNSMILIKCLYFWTLSWNKLSNEMILVNRFRSRISVLSSLSANFAWDPGICATFIDIIEDNDVYKRVRKKGLGMLMISSIEDEVFCQLKIWIIFPVLQMSFTEERYMLHVLLDDLLSPGSCFRHVKAYKASLSNKGVMLSLLSYMVCYLMKTNCDPWVFGLVTRFPNGCPTSIFMMALFLVSCDSYSMWQYYINMQGQAARSVPNMQGQTTTTAFVLLFSTAIIFGISRFVLCAWLPYLNALAGRYVGIYKCNESAAISKMMYGTSSFIFRPP